MSSTEEQEKEKEYASHRRGHSNPKYKDRLFRMVFSEKKELLELYNAVNGTTYGNAEELELNTLEDVVYIGMKNDVSFLIGNTLNMYEHQCTYNPNMPLRGLFYFADLYQGYIERWGENMYGSVLIQIPFPQYLVFYNGTKEEPDRTELYLSDSFMVKTKMESASLDCKVVMLNINLGHNKELMEKCQKLLEYAKFVHMVRSFIKEGNSFEEAVDRAVEDCLKEGILKELLQKNRAEVKNVILTEFNEQVYREGIKKEGISEGFGLGIEQGVELGTTRVNKLVGQLIKDKRFLELEASTQDPTVQRTLFEEYGI